MTRQVITNRKALRWGCYQDLELSLAAFSGRCLILVMPLSAGLTNHLPNIMGRGCHHSIANKSTLMDV